MSRRKNVDFHQRIEVRIPDSILCSIRAQLYSEVEQRVPVGAMSALTTTLFREWLEARGISV